MDCRMDGRVALITGSSKGLGRAMAIKFAESGAHVAICGRREAELNDAKAEVDAAGTGNVAAITADVSKADAIERLIDGTESALGPVDILINNAGHSMHGPFVDLTDEDWQEDFDLKVFAAIRTCRRVLPGMMERKWGRIINVLNIGSKAPAAEGAPTHVSRATGLALTKVLSKEAAPHNVLVNALLVGSIESDQKHRRWVAAGEQEPYEDFLAQIAKDQSLPLGRVGEAEEFANIACFLCSDAGSYIAGTAINVDGGKSPVV
ncbi:MAG TPA: short-chain dehydrogenase [Rhodospirillaceae bacterium]|nr:short-chain dehydrogenase [Rhodospirillaceae bacterium]HAT36092.1 short-chain dehydrogenase [Rhodospirillaceae bacterium]